MEIQELKKEIEDCYQWMADSTMSHAFCENGDLEPVRKEIDDLAHGCNDIYEVVVELHMTNGEKIILQNHCVESYINGIYSGDRVYIPYDDDLSGKKFGIVYAEWTDKDYRLHQARIPIESICFIDQWGEEVDWLGEKERILKEIEKNNASIEN